ncbi:hypothetical protein [Ruminococcus sp.]|uniref:hypothetical protein n=1 Tax=Ruminococcus sp. TaxID=41978 RepID=UPI0025F6FD2E|nr:hypothetical protein [Ruminococcus sp.]
MEEVVSLLFDLLYILLILPMLIQPIVLFVSSSKRFRGMKATMNEDGVAFDCKDPDLVKGVKQNLAFLLITIVIFVMNSIFRWEDFLARYGALFYTVVLVPTVVNFLFARELNNRYEGFMLCEDCFYLGGMKYDLKKFIYTVDGDTLIFRGNRTNKKIKVPEDKLPEIVDILERYYHGDTLSLPQSVLPVDTQNDDKQVLIEVEDDFVIDITERETVYVIKVTRRSDGKDMALTMAICEFAKYMEWWYDTKAEYAEGGAAVEKKCDIYEMRLRIRMYLYENRKAFLAGTEESK